jgi:hypothetical protein
MAAVTGCRTHRYQSATARAKLTPDAGGGGMLLRLLFTTSHPQEKTVLADQQLLSDRVTNIQVDVIHIFLGLTSYISCPYVPLRRKATCQVSSFASL